MTNKETEAREDGRPSTQWWVVVQAWVRGTGARQASQGRRGGYVVPTWNGTGQASS